MKRRILSIITALALCLSLCPTWALAVEGEPDTGLCDHHPEHTTDCGYAAPTKGQPCGHEHTEDCYTTDEADGEVLDCQHSHNSECGYVPADPGAPCAYVCKLCPIENLIAALPDTVAEDNAVIVRGQLDEILALYRELTEDEQGQLDLSRVLTLQEALDGANDPAPAPAAGRAEQQPGDEASVAKDGVTLYYATVEEAFQDAENAGSTDTLITLLADAEVDEALSVHEPITLDCGGHTLTGSNATTIYLKSLPGISKQASLTLRNGKVENTYPASDGGVIYIEIADALTVEADAVLEAAGPDSTGLDMAFSSPRVQISGKVTGTRIGISTYGATLNVHPGAVIAGGLYGIDVSGSSAINLNGGVITGDSESAIHIESGANPTITVGNGIPAILNDTPLTPPITGSTGAGTLVICADHRPGEWSEDGTRTCPNCFFTQQAVARLEKDGQADYVTSVPAFLRAFTADNSGAAVTLLTDVTWDGESITLPENTSFTLRLNGKTMMNTASEGHVFFLSGGSLTVEGSGSIISRFGETIFLEDGALTVNGGDIVSMEESFSALYLDGGTADIYGGRFTGGVQGAYGRALKLYGGVFEATGGVSIVSGDGRRLRDLLGTVEGKPCAYYDSDGVPITGKLDDSFLPGTVTVKECDHSVTEYQTTRETHSLICAACETALGTPESHVWDGNICSVCGRAAVVAETLAGGTTTQYGSLAEAWAAATAPGVTGAVITLVHDAAGDDTMLTLENGRSVTLKGQGHTISDHGIEVIDGELRIENCTFSSMDQRIMIGGGTAEIKDTVINEGVEIYGGEAALTGCTTGQVYVSGSAATVRLTDCTVTGNSMGIYVYNRGTAELTGCTVTGVDSGILISNSNLTIHSGSFTGTGEEGTGLYVSGDTSSVTLRGGTFSGASSIEISYSALTLGSLLGHTATARYAYYSDETGAPISVGPESNVMAVAVTVKECAVPHTYSHVQGTAVHSLTCASCGAQGAAEPCRYDNGVCACGSTLTVSLPEDLVYNGALQYPPVAVTLDGAPLDAGSYSVEYYGNKYAGTASVVLAGLGENLPFRVKQTFTIAPAELTVSNVSVESRPYDGTNEVAITAVTLDGVLDADKEFCEQSGLEVVRVDLGGLTGRTDGADAGVYASVTLPRLELNGYPAWSYTLIQPAGPFPASVTISKAAALTPKTGALDVANRQARTYAYGLDALLPGLPEGMRFGPGAVAYELEDVSLGGYYTGGAKIEGQTLKLPIAAVESDAEGDIGEVTVTIHTANFEDMTAAINVRSVNKIIPTGGPTLSAAALTYGQPLSTITLRGDMAAGATPVPGKFEWSSPDNRPAVQEAYAAAWVFTPTDNNTYAIVNGTSTIKVVPASVAGSVVTLSPTSFRYDGQTHSPTVTSVKLGDTTLTADTDYTVEIPTETAAGTYTVTVTGKGNYTGTAAATFTINPVETSDEFEDESGTTLRLEVETGLSTVPEALKNNTKYDTPAKIEAELRTRVEQVMSNVGENIAVFDVTLQYKDESGAWHAVDPNDFPAEGVTAILPYPDGTGATGYTFTVQHLISSGTQAGTMETLSYTLTADGLQCKFLTLSPVAIGYQAAAKPVDPVHPNPGGGSGGGGGGVSTYAVTVEKSEHGKVTSNRTNAGRGSTVTLTVTPEDGYVLDTLTVTDSRGNEIKLTAQGNGKYTFTMPGRAVTVKTAFAPLPDGTACDGGANCPSRGFTDLGSVGTWYHEAVDYVLRNNLMGGYGNGTFGPNDTLTRAQFAQILFNKEGRPVVNYLLQYSDVADGAWYTEAVRWATSQGVVSGYGNGMFGPNDNITREQLAVMLWRYAGSPAATEKELHFTDADKASSYALEALRWAVENGVMGGYGNGQLAPQGLATRAQVAQMLMNFLKK